MKRTWTVFLFALLAIAGFILTLILLTRPEVVVLNPKGMVGMKERDLILTAVWLMLIVVVPVFVFLPLFAWRYRADRGQGQYAPNWAHSHLAEALWWGVPCIIIAVLALFAYRSSHELDPFRPIDSDKKPLKIQVVALQWKWLFLYPEYGIASVNFVQFPAGTPLAFEITADAPMNSFWIPQLGGQVYAMPAMRSKLHLIADEEGTFRGSSANLSGKGFSGMTFTAQASSQEEFNRWVMSVQDTADFLDQQSYQQLVAPSEYQPVALYRLLQEDLFDQILMKYMMPPESMAR